jgi:hypothetical protein
VKEAPRLSAVIDTSVLLNLAILDRIGLLSRLRRIQNVP